VGIILVQGDRLKEYVVKYLLSIILSLAISSVAEESAKHSLPAQASVAAQPLPAKASAPLDLAKLVLKDSDQFDVYTARIVLLADSIAQDFKLMDSAKVSEQAKLPVLTPKDEFEKQADFDKRKNDWESKLAVNTKNVCDALNARIAQLQVAQKVIEDFRAGMLASISIQTKPAGAQVKTDKGFEGITPVLINSVAPGKLSIHIQRDGFGTIDTQLVVTTGSKLALAIDLPERSPFSQKDEIDLVQILKKDTDAVPVYQARIQKIRARQDQVDAELKVLLANLTALYPPLAPQKAAESNKDFATRKTNWEDERTKQHKALEAKYLVYWERLDHAIDVLNDYIAQNQTKLTREMPTTAAMTLGKYDAEKERFEFELADTSSKASPFIYKGKVGIPVQVAKEMNRKTEGFVPELQYLNDPFITSDGKVNLAMAKLSFTHKAAPVIVEGAFVEVPKYVGMPGYAEWKAHADSLLNGKIKVHNLDYSYLDNWKSCGIAPKVKAKKGLSWKGWSRIGLAGAAVVFSSVGLYEDRKAADEASRAHPTTVDQANQVKDKLKNHDNIRNAMWVGDILAVGLGVATFAF